MKRLKKRAGDFFSKRMSGNFGGGIEGDNARNDRSRRHRSISEKQGIATRKLVNFSASRTIFPHGHGM
jgi:hypothetical protein